MSDWGVPAPDLTLVKNAARVLEGEGLDVHTITVILADGGWDVEIQATNEDLEQISTAFLMDRHGARIERVH